MAAGYVKIHRQLADNDLWTNETFSRGQAWVDLIMRANWKKGGMRVRGIWVPLERGQLVAAQRYLSRRWKWSQGKVRRFIKELENDRNIDSQKNNVCTVLTITNYDEYQSDSSTDGSQTDRRRIADGSQTDRNRKKGKKEQEGKEPCVVVPEVLDTTEFREAWAEWEQHRKEKNKKLTPTSVSRQMKELAGFGPERAIAAIQHSIAKGWTGIFEPKDSSKSGEPFAGIREWLESNE